MLEKASEGKPMKNSARLFVFAFLFFVALSSVAHAGMDADRVVVELSGKAWVRPFTRKNNRLRFGPWKPLRRGEHLSSGSEVRVETGSLRLQVGDTIQDPATRPTDEKIACETLTAGSVARLNGQRWAIAHHAPILQTLRGKVTRTLVPGRIPAREYWKKQGVNLR